MTAAVTVPPNSGRRRGIPGSACPGCRETLGKRLGGDIGDRAVGHVPGEEEMAAGVPGIVRDDDLPACLPDQVPERSGLKIEHPDYRPAEREHRGRS